MEELESLIWVTRTTVAAGAAHCDRDFVRRKIITCPRALRSIQACILLDVIFSAKTYPSSYHDCLESVMSMSTPSFSPRLGVSVRSMHISQFSLVGLQYCCSVHGLGRR